MRPACRQFKLCWQEQLGLIASRPKLPSRQSGPLTAEYFLAAQKGGQFELEKNVRLGPDGVFIADRKVAGLAQVVEQYGRQGITEIRTAETESNSAGCALAGYFGGGIVGGLPGAIIGGAVGRDTGPALAGMMVGWSMGAVYVYRRCRHKPEKLIYSALYGSALNDLLSHDWPIESRTTSGEW
jgi:hypothetical protein